MRKLQSIVELARPSHWVKNLLVFAALIFSGRYFQPSMWWLAALAFAEFCLLASGVYAWNDVFDRKADASNPVLCRRPIPSGRLSLAEAGATGTVLLVAGLALASTQGLRPLLVGAAYVLLNALYNTLLRHRPIADVVAVALGFVLRAMAGGVAIGVPVSAWLIVCTFMLCVFLALIKRRAEIALLGQQTAQTVRPVHAFYTLGRLEHMLAVSAGLAVVTYISYCVSEREHGAHMVWTIPIVLYGMFRLYSLAVGSSPAGPIELVRRDKVMWFVAAVWLLVVLLAIHYKDAVFLQGLLRQ